MKTLTKSALAVIRWCVLRTIQKVPAHAALALVLMCGTSQGAQQRATVEREGDCFRFESYDAWIEFIKQRSTSNQEFSINQFKQRFPRDMYETSKRSIKCSFFTYQVQGVSVGGFAARPAGENAGQKLPVIAYNRGGSGESTAVTFGQMLAEIMPLASQGFFVIGSQYRTADEFGGKDVEDVLALFDIIDARPDVDRERIGMMGWSRGGMMTMLAASRSTRLKAVALAATPTDLLQGLKSRPDMEAVFKDRIPNYSAEKEAALTRRSPVFLLDTINPALPILILHGSADSRAPAEHALDLASKLQSLGRAYRLVIYPNGNHGLTQFEAEVRGELTSWFKIHLAEDGLTQR